MMKYIIDEFGEEVETRKVTEDTFRAKVIVADSPTFYGLIFSFEGKIRIVEPDDVSELKIIPGKDYCTLVTCTPYGINTHRMLVRGHRIVEDESTFRIPADARRVSTAITIPAIGLPMMLVTLACMLLHNRRKKPRIQPADLRQIAEQDLAAEQTQKRRKH